LGQLAEDARAAADTTYGKRSRNITTTHHAVVSAKI
jgi:hypothetical protein